MVRPHLAAATLLCIATSACVYGNARSEPAAPETSPPVAMQPQLIACRDYTPPVFHWTTENRMWIRVAVKTDGTVEPGSAQHEPSRFDRGGADAVARAMKMAESCVFSPVTADGEAVEAIARVRIAFSG